MTDDAAAKLSQLVSSGNAQAFLTQYLSMAGQGYNCPIPSSLEISGIKEGWEQIIGESLGASYDDEFIDDLSVLWSEAVTKQGGQITENFADQMLGIIQGTSSGQSAAPQSHAAPGTQKATQQSQTAQQSQAMMAQKHQAKVNGAQGGNDSVQLSPEATGPSVSTPNYLQEVSSSISSDYRALKTMTVPSMEKLKANMSDNIARNKPMLFLKNYLSQIKHNKRPDVPMELNHKAIRNRWERIITFGFGIAHPEFLDKLTDYWLNLVHVSGPMTDPQALEKILEKIYINLSKEPQESTPIKKKIKKKKNLFQKLFKI